MAVPAATESLPTVYFEKAPLMGNLFLFLWRFATLCREGCLGVVFGPLGVARYVFLSAILVIVKIYVPIQLLAETSLTTAHEVDFGHSVIGSTCWIVVMFQTEEDVLRDMWWLTVWFAKRGKTKSNEMLENSVGSVIGYFLSLIYDCAVAVVFGLSTWAILRNSETVLDKAQNCAALTVILLADEAIYDHMKFDVPGAAPKFITPWHEYAEGDAKAIVATADFVVFVCHAVFVCTVAVFSMIYVANGA